MKKEKTQQAQASLIAITTFNQLDYTRRMLESIRALPTAPFDLLLVDDASQDETVAFCRAWGVEHIIAKTQPGGVTDSWNRAYAYFKAGPWQNLFLANNDVLLAPNAIEVMVDLLTQRPQSIVGPVCNPDGAPYNKEQWVSNYTPDSPEVIELPEGLNVNGFFFGVQRSVIAYEFAPDLLFDPQNLNYHNEEELAARLYPHGFRSLIATRAVLFHYKNRSFQIADRSTQDNLNDYAAFLQHRGA
jgi:GT2 family glycosyltransferase